MRKTLEYYIEKYGEEQGKNRYEGVQKCEQTKAEKYAKQPYKRLTKEWYIWRYGEEEGLQRFSKFAAKSAHTLENFIRLHGEIEGPKKYQETISKKNSIEQIRKKYSKEEADKRIAAISENRKRATKEFYSSMSPEEKEIWKNSRKRPKKSGLSKLEDMINIYGEEEGLQRYRKMLSKQFKGPNRMTKPALEILQRISEKLDIDKFSQLYYDSIDDDKKEFWLFDKEKRKMYSFDFTHRESKAILEYHGDFWHPINPSDEIHPVTKKTLTEMYEYDQQKRKFAESEGFDCFEIRSSMSESEMLEIVDLFVNKIHSFQSN